MPGRPGPRRTRSPEVITDAALRLIDTDSAARASYYVMGHVLGSSAIEAADQGSTASELTEEERISGRLAAISGRTPA